MQNLRCQPFDFLHGHVEYVFRTAVPPKLDPSSFDCAAASCPQVYVTRGFGQAHAEPHPSSAGAKAFFRLFSGEPQASSSLQLRGSGVCTSGAKVCDRIARNH